MSERILNVRFTHPFEEKVLELALPADTRFLEVTKILYAKDFVEKKKGNYQYIIDGRLCALNNKLEDYAYTGDDLEVFVHGLLTVLA